MAIQKETPPVYIPFQVEWFKAQSANLSNRVGVGQNAEASEWPKPVVLRVDEASQMPGGQLCRVNTYNTSSIP